MATAKKMRELKPSPLGRLRREQVEKAVTDVHVLPAAGGHWTVRTIAAPRTSRNFASKEAALSFARGVAARRSADVLVHAKHGRVEMSTGDDNAIFELVFDDK